MNKSEFIPTIAPLVKAENKKRGNPLFNSVVIAQAICESGWGQSTIMMKANAIFGIKATSSWKGKVYSAQTKECYDGINYTTITDLFRAYDNLEESIADYFDLICNSSRYSKALNTNSPLECITAIKNGGYATSPTYINTIMSIINSNNLTQYDNEIVEIPTQPNTDIKVGDKVKVLNPIQYNGQTFKTYYEEYDVIEVKDDRIVIGIGQTVTCAINIKNVEKIGTTQPNTDIKVGDKVKVLNPIQYNGQTFKTYYEEYDVIEVKGDRVVIGIGQTVTCAININNIKKV